MTEQEILTAIARIVAPQLGVPVPSVTRSAKLVADLGADSLDILELVMAIEEDFDFTIQDEEIESVKTVGDVLALIYKAVGVPPAEQE